MRHSGWYPDHVLRVFRRGRARFSNDLVHERVHPRHEIAPYGSPAVSEEEVTGHAAERRPHHGPQHNHGAFVIHATLQAGPSRRKRLQALCHEKGEWLKAEG